MVFLGWPASAAPQPGQAEVRAVKGSATVSTNSASVSTNQEAAQPQPLREGAILRSGAVVKTGPASTVDLFLGHSAGMVRVAEDSTLALDKLTLTETGADTAVEVQLHLPDGEMYFDVNKLSKASRYEIKLPTGVAGIRGTRGCLCFRRAGNTKPPVVLIEGKLYLVHVSGAGGAMASHVLSAPPAVYFSVTEGIKEAPPQLLQQVEQELQQSKKEGGKPPKTPPPHPPPRQPTLPEPALSPGTGHRDKGN